jgi:hypothetical protein
MALSIEQYVRLNWVFDPWQQGADRWLLVVTGLVEVAHRGNGTNMWRDETLHLDSGDLISDAIDQRFLDGPAVGFAVAQWAPSLTVQDAPDVFGNQDLNAILEAMANLRGVPETQYQLFALRDYSVPFDTLELVDGTTRNDFFGGLDVVLSVWDLPGFAFSFGLSFSLTMLGDIVEVATTIS